METSHITGGRLKLHHTATVQTNDKAKANGTITVPAEHRHLMVIMLIIIHIDNVAQATPPLVKD